MKTKEELKEELTRLTREIQINSIADIKTEDNKKIKKTIKKLKRILKEIYDVELPHTKLK